MCGPDAHSRCQVSTAAPPLLHGGHQPDSHLSSRPVVLGEAQGMVLGALSLKGDHLALYPSAAIKIRAEINETGN